MEYTVFRESKGVGRRAYYVPDGKITREKALLDVANITKTAKAKLEVIDVWIVDDGESQRKLYTLKIKSGTKNIAVRRKRTE